MIPKLFQNLKQSKQTAFMPFVTAGDPDLQMTERLLLALAESGCHLAEVGIPYSDPIADGPVIQASYTRALNNHVKLADIFTMLKRVTGKTAMPIVTMVSYAIIFRTGVDEYLRQAIAAGVSGAIVPDMPVDESIEFAEKCQRQNFSLIQLITPTTPRERAIEIASHTTGFIYYVSVTGITGERTELPTELKDNLEWLKTKTDLPICVGFGISQPEQVEALKSSADGLIVGSAIVRRIAKATTDNVSPDAVIADVSTFAKSMLSALE